MFTKLSIQLKDISFAYPYLLTLLDYSNAVVAGDGIHFFDNNFEIEEESKKVNFTISNDNDLEKFARAQFPNEYGGYILIFIQNIIYIFDNENNLKIQNLSYSINGEYYSLIPYKMNNNNFIFIIPYKESLSIILANCIFDFSNLDSELIISKKSIIIPNYNGNSPTGLCEVVELIA